MARWGGEPFQGELTRWIDEALAPRGEVRAGPLLPEKIRFWSAVFRIPLAGPGPSRQAWCKVGNPGQAFEGELTLGVPHAGVKDLGRLAILEFRDPDGIALELFAPKA